MQKQVACAKRRNLAEPPPAHLEGDKRRTGFGLEGDLVGLVKVRTPESVTPACEGFASGAGEAVDGGRPKDLRRELQG